MDILSSWVLVQYICDWCKSRTDEDVGYPAVGAADGGELSCGCMQTCLCPLQKQQVLLIAEPAH